MGQVGPALVTTPAHSSPSRPGQGRGCQGVSCLSCPPFRHRANSQPPDRSPSVPTGQLTFNWPKGPSGSTPAWGSGFAEGKKAGQGPGGVQGLPSASPSSFLTLTAPSSLFLPSQPSVPCPDRPQPLLFPLNYVTFYLPGTLEFTKCFYIYHRIESTPGRAGETLKIPSNCQVFLLKMQTSPEDEQLGWQPLVPQTNLFHPLPHPQPLSTSGWGWGGGRGRSSAFWGAASAG